MFKVHYGNTERELTPDSWFADVCDREVLLTDFSKKLLKEVSGCEVLGENLIVSDVLGPISPERMGSGCLALLYLMYEDDEKYGGIATRWLGDNLAPYLREIARVKTANTL